MNDAKLAVLLATVITSLDETTGETREGILYAGLMGHGVSYEDFMVLMRALVRMGAVERGPQHLLKLTARGREIAKKLADQIAAEKRKKLAPVSGCDETAHYRSEG